MPNVDRFIKLVNENGQDVFYHREDDGVPCPCLSPEGYRSVQWHIDNPPGDPNPDLDFPPWNGVNPPICNPEGMQEAVATEGIVKAFIQPVQSGATRRLTSDYAVQLFGEVQMDDHLGIFPLQYGNIALSFQDWSQVGEDYIEYLGRRFTVVNANLIPDPDGGAPHHIEVGLRLVNS